MSTFPYPSLDLNQNSIRLLHVNKGAWPSHVHCSLVEATTDPDEAVPYKALSYTWGAVEGEGQQLPLPRIFVNNRLFPATDNLRMALSHIQDPNHDIMLWVDAICINQHDNREKGHQVKQMAQIYKNAEEVLIWLGPSNEEIRDLLEFVTSVDQKAIAILTPRTSGQWVSHCHNLMRDQYKNAKTSQNIIALQQLLSRRWFKRIWVLQEVAMARSARILCGSSSCPARTFSLMPSFFKTPTTLHSQAVLDLMPRIRSNTWWASDRTLHNLITKFAEGQATHPADMVYALLSMSQDACDSTIFYPSYEMSSSDVFKNTASFLIFGRINCLAASLSEVQVRGLALPLTELAEILVQNAVLAMDFRRGPKDIGSEVFAEFIKGFKRIELNTVQMLNCLSTFLFIALTSSPFLKTWFEIRRPRLLGASVRGECSELEARMKGKPGAILTLVFDQQNVKREYRKIEFPIFDRFDNLERLDFPEDLDLRDRRDGYDSFKRFNDLEGPFHQTRPTENVS
jgi:hypothetical protein